MAIITQLPLDLKGTLTTNLFVGEEHTLTRVNGKTNRMFTPKYGAYYKDSLEVRTASGAVLSEDVDYVTTYYYDEIWELNAKAACAIIVVTNPAVANSVRITYRALGGHYCLSVDELSDMLKEVDEYPKELGWDDIRNKPLQFVPLPHTHEYWQLYGLESTVSNLDMIADSVGVGRKGVLDDNRYYYQGIIDLAEKAIADYSALVMAHINNRSNPHQTDKTKLGLGEINNWGMATNAEAVTMTVNNKYQPIGGVYDQLYAHVIPLYDAHLRDLNNPHNVTIDDPLINVYNRAQIIGAFGGRLLRTSPAYSSTLYSGLNSTQIWDAVRVNFSTSNVAPNQLFIQDQIAQPIAGWNPADYVLTGAGVYRRLDQLLSVINTSNGGVYFIGAAALSSYLHLEVGTFVIQTVFQDFNDRRQSYTISVHERVGYGNGWVKKTKG